MHFQLVLLFYPLKIHSKLLASEYSLCSLKVQLFNECLRGLFSIAGEQHHNDQGAQSTGQGYNVVKLNAAKGYKIIFQNLNMSQNSKRYKS